MALLLISCDGGNHGYGFVPVNCSVVVHVLKHGTGGKETTEKLMLSFLYCKHSPPAGRGGITATSWVFFGILDCPAITKG